MEGRRGRPPNSERQHGAGNGEGSGARRRKGRPPNVGHTEFPSPSEAKLLRKLEAQEIARQAAQMKLMRKLEKQALARAAKEARKQQAIMAAEERRKQKEQIKILKQQQEKIKRIQQIRMEKELRAQQILEAKRKKREEAANAKIMEAEKRLKERERRRQHVMLMKAVEARKKAEVFSDCLMVVQFLRSFGKVLGMEQSEVPTLGVLQEGLLNLGNSMGQVQDLLAKSILGDHLTNVGLNRDNVSEVLQQYMESHCAQTELADVALSLKTKAFQAHTPAQKASILAFLVNELACSRSVVSEIDKSLDQMNVLRKDECIVEGKLKKLKNIHAKRTGRREAGGGDESHATGPEELEKEQERLRNFKPVRIKEEPQEEGDEEEEEEAQVEDAQQQQPEGKTQPQVKQEEEQRAEQEVKKEDEKPPPNKDTPLSDSASCPHKEPSKPLGDLATLCCTPDVSMPSGTTVTASASSPPTSKPPVLCSTATDSVALVAQFGAPPPQFGIPLSLQHHQHLLANDQLLRVLTERSGHWFSLLPRSPCDESSLIQPTTSNVQPRSPPARSCSPHQHLQPPSASSSPSNAAHDGQGNPTVSPLQVKPGGALLSLPMCAWSGGMISPNLPMCSSPMPICPLAEGNASPLMAPSVSTSKSGSPPPPGDKPCALSPAIDLPRNHDQPQPQPIPEDMLLGWWKMIDMEELQVLMKTLHSRGIRERALHKQLQKSIELVSHTFNKNKEGQVSVETLQEWCVEEQAMETDIALLQQVEELERRVTSASLQVKGWMHPEPQSEREDLLYYEHKPLPKVCPGAELHEERGSEKGLRRQPSNPLDIAVMRLAELERHIERRYLRSPLGTTIQIRLDNVGTVTVPAPAPSTSAGGEGGEEEIAPGMKVWRKALSEVRNSSQLAMCLQQLQKSIAWERSIMKVASSQSPKNKKPQSRVQSGGGGKKSAETTKKSKKQQEACEEDEAVGGSSTSNSSPKKTATASSQAKKSSPAPPAAKPESPACVKRAKTARDNTATWDSAGTNTHSILLAELERHQDAWPFLTPVNLKSVPGYRKVIKKPMDFSTIREKLVSSQYQNLETFIIDVNLVFDNCEKFNEDNSDIGRAGHNMRKFFEKRWTELLKQTN
ncbi:Bromodomain adjacent to zinc finger domain protein 2B [Bagarius yarrelli]|uniref:Bromodomain adjacent to zinc finger domain protein 2B n=1 Tax=Bagarius yarrelli TaxID=175774 RepID=A0A556VBS9_BAGYA|nr:Bromodomain adjacent to zinc finger domain protein 2B [Bagarius yarrelli]